MKEIFRITAKEISVYTLLYLVVVSAALFNVVNISQESVDQNIFSGTVSLFKTSLESVNNEISLNSTVNTVLLALFWAIAGSFIYFTLWYLINLFVHLKNCLKISTTFVHPRSFHQSEFWLSSLLYVLSKIATMVTAIALTIASMIHSIPVVSELFYRSFSAQSIALTTASFVLVLVVVFVVGHIINVLIKYSLYK